MLPSEWQEKLPQCQASLIKVESTLAELLRRSRLDPKQTAIAEQAIQALQTANECLVAIEEQSDSRSGSGPRLILLLGGLSDPDGDVPFG